MIASSILNGQRCFYYNSLLKWLYFQEKMGCPKKVNPLSNTEKCKRYRANRSAEKTAISKEKDRIRQQKKRDARRRNKKEHSECLNQDAAHK